MAIKYAYVISSLPKNILNDWSAYLSTILYKKALCHFLGIHLKNEHQRFIPLSPNTILHISGLSAQKNNLRANLQKYLNTSKFNELLWVNFDQNQIDLFCLHHSA